MQLQLFAERSLCNVMLQVLVGDPNHICGLHYISYTTNFRSLSVFCEKLSLHFYLVVETGLPRISPRRAEGQLV